VEECEQVKIKGQLRSDKPTYPQSDHRSQSRSPW
jgi:hypothetical protein